MQSTPSSNAIGGPFSEALAGFLRERGVRSLDTLVVLGSGMSGCYAPGELDIVHDAGPSGIVGHSGRLALLGGARSATLVSLGRRHLYEGYAPEEVTAVVTAAAALGATALVLANAAGGLNAAYRPGDVMLIESCLGFLLGRRAGDGVRVGYGIGGGSRDGEEFDVSSYDAIADAALARGVAVRRGVYAGVLGPSYETRAEIRMLRRVGADAVGMSTVIEARAGRALGMRTAALSLITNVLTDTDRVGLDHGHVVEQGRLGEAGMRVVLDAALEGMGHRARRSPPLH